MASGSVVFLQLLQRLQINMVFLPCLHCLLLLLLSDDYQVVARDTSLLPSATAQTARKEHRGSRPAF